MGGGLSPDAGQPLDGTLVIRLGYRGAGFSGIAEQPGQRTVGTELRHALERPRCVVPCRWSLRDAPMPACTPSDST